jgi:hypothetical protein
MSSQQAEGHWSLGGAPWGVDFHRQLSVQRTELRSAQSRIARGRAEQALRSCGCRTSSRSHAEHQGRGRWRSRTEFARRPSSRPEWAGIGVAGSCVWQHDAVPPGLPDPEPRWGSGPAAWEQCVLPEPSRILFRHQVPATAVAITVQPWPSPCNSGDPHGQSMTSNRSQAPSTPFSWCEPRSRNW